jgi:hypothetical protein
VRKPEPSLARGSGARWLAVPVLLGPHDVQTVQARPFAPGHLHGLVEGVPTALFTADRHQDVLKQAGLCFQCLLRRRAGLELARQQGAQ